MKPVIKWAGGKSRLLPELLKRVPESFETYAEPFAGGAALFFTLASESPRRFRNAILVDSNPDLIAFYRAVRDDVGALLAALGTYRNEEEFFLRVREQNATLIGPVERGARFLFLNKTCFNGLWRVNRKGKFNVPFGHYEAPNFRDEESLRAASSCLKGTLLKCGDFTEAIGLKAGDFAYLDPPYVPKSKTANFVGYSDLSAGGFGPDSQRRLAAWVRRTAEWGVRTLLSNSDTPESRALYEGLPVDAVTNRRSIAASGDRPMVGEILVKNWEGA